MPYKGVIKLVVNQIILGSFWAFLGYLKMYDVIKAKKKRKKEINTVP